MSHVHSFPPISANSARVLILGSMPGKASLAANQYYAHPQNYFWRFMESILEIPRDEDYERRCKLLIKKRIAVWDVLKTCTRATSLDSDIVESTIVPNDFESFLSSHPKIKRICFNGVKAAEVFDKYVATTMSQKLTEIELIRLPSTSPANASIPLDVKLEKWQAIRLLS